VIDYQELTELITQLELIQTCITNLLILLDLLIVFQNLELTAMVTVILNLVAIILNLVAIIPGLVITITNHLEILDIQVLAILDQVQDIVRHQVLLHLEEVACRLDLVFLEGVNQVDNF